MASPLRADGQPTPFVPLPTVDGGFGTVLADPPWRFTNRTGKVAPEHSRLSRYDTMDTEAIAALPIRDLVAHPLCPARPTEPPPALPIGDLVADAAHCYLWVPNALLAEGLAVMASWGFT